MNLESYIDAQTIQQRVMMLMFSPNLNTATMLEVSFDVSDPEPVGRFSIRHFRGLTGRDLTQLVILDTLAMVLATVVIALAIRASVESLERVKGIHEGRSFVDTLELAVGRDLDGDGDIGLAGHNNNSTPRLSRDIDVETQKTNNDITEVTHRVVAGIKSTITHANPGKR